MIYNNVFAALGSVKHNNVFRTVCTYNMHCLLWVLEDSTTIDRTANEKHLGYRM